MGARMCDDFFFFSSRRRHTRCSRDWSSDVCSSDLALAVQGVKRKNTDASAASPKEKFLLRKVHQTLRRDRKSTRLNSSHGYISYAVFCLKKKKRYIIDRQHTPLRSNGTVSQVPTLE